MAKKMRAGLLTTSKNVKVNTTWLKNAMKSVGIAGSDYLRDIAPNLHEITSTGVNTSKELITTIKRNNNSTSRIAESLSSNKYVKYAQSAYRNVMTDIKSGNLAGDSERTFDSGDGSTEGFSFGDDGADGSGINVNVSSPDNSAGFANLSEQMERSTTAQVKMQKASMDAYIAVSAAGMQQVGQIGSQIVGQLNNVNSNLSALVQYNNENMTKFIQASMAYYERTGSKENESSSSQSNEKISAADVFNNKGGGLSLSRYKDYVKQQLKKNVDGSTAGIIKSLVEDDDMMGMLVSNPLGFLSKGLMGYMVPTILKTSIQSMETTLSNFMPTMLSQLSDLANDTSSGVMGHFKRFLGNTFGLKSERVKSFNRASIDRGPIPFDGETKHAITEIITKELRDQTGYLQIIANHYDSDAKNTARKNAEFWSWNSNAYVDRKTIDSQIADQIVNSIKGVFDDSRFGSALNELVYATDDERQKKEIEFSLEELYVEIEKSSKHLSLPDLISIVKAGGATKKTKQVIIDRLNSMALNDPDSYHNLNVARLKSQAEANETKNSIMSDMTRNQVYNSSFGGNADIDAVLKEVKGYGKKRSVNVRPTEIDVTNSVATRGFTGNLVADASNAARSMMQHMMSGDARGLFTEGGSFIANQLTKIGGKVFTTLFGEKSDDGYRKGGIFTGVSNGFTDMFAAMKRSITGKGYTDSKGNVYDDTEDSVVANFKNIGNTIKDGIMLKIFGKERGEDGKYKATEEKGIFGNIVDTFKSGFDGWTEAFFGSDMSAEDRKERIEGMKKYAKDSLPNTITGGALGYGFGAMTGGSLLGTLVGGPIGGAALGAATGFLARNEKFQNWLFGEKDEEGNRTGGLISKSVQDFVKTNKTYLAGSAALGVGSSALGISGGGVLGTLVGGPIAGALLGVAGGVVLKSKMFNNFLFGDEETGQKGIIKAVTDAFNSSFKSEETANMAKSLGMGAIGAVGGGLTAAAVGSMGILGAALTPLGPIGGALAGLALSIKAQEGNFKQWMFGKKDGIEINGKKFDKEGVIGRFFNTLNANIIRPMKSELTYIGKDFMNTVKHNILAPFSFAAEMMAEKLGSVVSNITDTVSTTFAPVADAIKEGFSNAIAPITNVIGTTMEGVTDFAYKTFKTMISAPGNLIKATMDVLHVKERLDRLTKPITDLLKDTKHFIFSGINKLFGLAGASIKGLFKDIGAVAGAPFRLIGKGVKAASEFVGNTAIGKAIKDKYNEYKVVGEDSPIWERMKAERHNARVDRDRIKKDRDTARRHNKNAKLIAKWTNGQFSEDTEEAREYLRYKKPEMYRKLLDIDPETGKSRNTSITEEKRAEEKAAKIAEEGRGTAGMSEEALGRANVAELNEEGKQTFYLHKLYNLAKEKLFKSKTPNVFDVDDEESSEDTSDTPDDREPTQHELNNRVFGRTRQNIYKALDALGVAAHLPHKAKGGKTEDGYAVVGEEGPEIIKTNDGDEVIDAKKSRAIIDKNKKADKAAQLEAFDDATTAKERREALANEQKEKEEKGFRAAVLRHLNTGSKETKKFNTEWFKMYSKKGLIGMAAIAGFLYLKKNLPGLIDGITSFLANFGSTTLNDITWTQKNGGRTNGNSAKEQAKKNITDIKNGNFITDENGEVTHQSDNRMRFLARLGMNFLNSDTEFFFDSNTTRAQKKFFQGTKKAGGAAKKGVTKVGGALKSGASKVKNSRLGQGVKSKASSVKNVVKNRNSILTKGKEKLLHKGMLSKNKNIRDITEKAIQLDNKAYDKRVAKSIAKRNKANAKTAKKMLKKEKSSKLMTKVIGYIDEFFDFVTKKMGKKGGAKAVMAVKDTVLKTLKTKWDDIAGKLGAKLGLVGGGKAAGAAFTAGLSEVIFAAIGSIEGLSGTAKLFHVSSKDVDGDMMTISSIISALAGTTIGSIIDIIFGVIGDIAGFDILHSVATAMYTTITGSDSKDAQKLISAQAAFKEVYLKERDKTLEKQYKTQQKAGIIGKDVTYDQFVQGVKNGTYSANYDSFQDWNTKKNKSIGDHIMTGAGKLVKGTGKGLAFVGKGLFGGKETSYTDDKGNVYTKGKNGMWNVTDANGNKLGSIAKDAIPKNAKKTVVKKKGIVGNVVSGTKSLVTSLKKDGIKKTAKKVGTKIVDGYRAIDKGIHKGLDWLVTKKTTEGFVAKDGSYYDSTGQHYSINHVKMDKISLTELSEMISKGELEGPTEITTKERGFVQIYKTAYKSLEAKWKSAAESLGKFTSNVKSKAENIGDAISSSVSYGAKKVKNFFASHKEKAWMLQDGSYYLSDGKSFSLYSANGDKIADGIEFDKVNAMIRSGAVKEKEVKVDSKIKTGLTNFKRKLDEGWIKAADTLTKIGSDVGKKAKQLGTQVVEGAKNLPGKVFRFLHKHKEKRWTTIDGGYYQSNGNTFDHYNANGDKIAEGITTEEFEKVSKSGVLVSEEGKVVEVSAGIKTKFAELRNKIGKSFEKGIKSVRETVGKVAGTVSSITEGIKEKGIAGYIGSFFKDSKEQVWYDTKGNYYKLNSSGSYDYYNMNGDKISEKIEASKIEEMVNTNLLTKGDLIKDSKAKKAMKDIKKSVEEAWDKAKDTVKSGWDSFKSFITGGNGDGFDTAKSLKRGGRGSGRFVGGGRGPETLNGGTYFSQNDPRWANNAYNVGEDNATMGNSGCGPAAMAMVASDVTGKNVSPTQMANLAKATGNRDNTGTNWNFINQASNMMGIGGNQKLNPTANDISSQLDNGPVILSGTGSGTGADPYTKSGHYVVATGKDENGNVLINDPRGKSYSKKFSLNSLAGKTGSSWSFDKRGGFGRGRFARGGRGINVDKWISIVRAVKKAIAAKKVGYSQTNWITITVGGKSLKIRTDCSGFTAACLKFYGVMAESVNMTSYNFTNKSNSTMKKTGFTSRAFTSWNDLAEGDIIATNGHVEIFARNEGGKHYVYNCGSNSSNNNPNATVSGHKSYTTVWSPGAAGASSVSGTTSDSGDSSSSTSETTFGKLTNALGSFFGEASKRALGGDFKNTNYDSVFNPDTGSSSSDSSGGVASADISGSDVAKSVYDYFTKAGYSKAAAIGILANLKAESGLRPDAIQGNGKGPAAGIAQWENYNTGGGRWGSLNKYAKSKGKSWKDLGTQLEFINKELPGLNTYFKNDIKYGNGIPGSTLSNAGAKPTTYSAWKKSTDYQMATRQFEGAFERAGKPHMERRIQYAKEFYNKFAKGGNGGGFGDASISNRKIKQIMNETNTQGGRGSVDYTSSSSIQNSKYSSGYSNASNANDYIKTTKDSGVTALLVNAIEILAAIAGNTSEASAKLNALKNLQNNNSNNIIVNGNNAQSKGNKFTTENPASLGNNSSRKDITAKMIAQGGY